jgi:hypothetical protein
VRARAAKLYCQPMPSHRVRVLVACGLLLSCDKTREIAEPAPSAQAAPVASTAPGRKAFGAPLGTSPSLALADVLKAPEKYADQSVLVEGDVRKACSRKGCWMELSAGKDAGAPGCRVTFKDYGFFVPTDSEGSKARVEAKVESKLIKPAMVTHLEEEGAKFTDKAPDGSAREVRLVATGVELWR